MARWQELYEMVLAGHLSPAQIIDLLKAKPSRLRRLLASKRLAARLAVHQDMADHTHVHRSLNDIARAAHRLGELLESGEPGAAQRACHEVLADGRNLRESVTKRQEAEVKRFVQKQYDSIKGW